MNRSVSEMIRLARLSSGYFLTTTINQALPFLILPILTRYWEPEQYGIYAIFSVCLVLSNSLSGTSVPAVISKNFFSESRDFIAEIIGSSILLSAGLSVASGFFLLIAWYFFDAYISIPLLWLMLIPPASFSFVVFSIALNIMINNQKVWHFGFHQIANTVVNLGISLILVMFFYYGWEGRAVGILSSYFISSAAALIYLYKRGYLIFKGAKTKIAEVARVIVPLIPNSFQLVIISQVGFFFMAYFFTKEDTGLYAIGYQIAFVVKLLIITIGLFWSPFLYKVLSQKQPINRNDLTRKFYVLMAALTGGFIVVNLLSGFILQIMTTPDYFVADKYILPLSLGFLFHGLYVLFVPILIKYNQQNYIAKVSLINLVFMLIVNYLFIDMFGEIGVAYAFCLTYLLILAMLLWRAQKIFPLPWFRSLVK